MSAEGLDGTDNRGMDRNKGSDAGKNLRGPAGKISVLSVQEASDLTS